jgi:hypothetical protein
VLETHTPDHLISRSHRMVADFALQHFEDVHVASTNM